MALDSVPGTHRAKALALDLWWRELGHPASVTLPDKVPMEDASRAELRRLDDARTNGGLLSDLAWAEAFLAIVPPPSALEPDWESVISLEREGLPEEAAIEQFHVELHTLVRLVRRRRQRTDDVLTERAARVP